MKKQADFPFQSLLCLRDEQSVQLSYAPKLANATILITFDKREAFRSKLCIIAALDLAYFKNLHDTHN